MGELQDRVALVTGAASGIGWALAETFASAGAKVGVADRNEEAARAAVQRLTEGGFEAMALVGDVTREEQVQHSINQLLTRYGRLDILVNNAGIQHVAPLEEFPSEQFERLVQLMLTAPFYAIKHAFPLMKAQSYGRILNMASINGLVGFAGKAAYNAAKHGVIGLTKVAALEGATHGITVNALCPGYVDTPLVRNQFEDLARTYGVEREQVLAEVIYPLVPQQRLLDPSEVADYAVFLASEKGRSITGQAVVIDGGYTAR